MKQKMEQPKASSCPSTPNHKPHFFKFLFPNPFANLRIPKKFYKHLPAVPPKQASLVTQTDTFWRVDVCQNEEGICFTRGWSEFAKAHDLQLGYLVVFRYEGNMVFNVKVFDTTSCLKDYSLTTCKSPTFKFESSKFVGLTTSDVNIESEGETQVPVASGRKRKIATGKAQFVDLTSDVNIKSEGETQIPVVSGRKRKIATGKAQLVGEEDGEEGEPILKNRVQQKMIQKSSLNMPTVPQFEKTLNCSSTTKYRKCLNIPKRFCMENGLLSERTMFLKNSKEKKWQVKFSFGQNNGVLTVGWRVFSIENGLKNGDECIFQLINKNTFLVNVRQNQRVSSVFQDIPVASGRKRRNATGKAQFVDLTSDVNIKSEGETQIPVASGRKRKIATGKAQLVGEEDREGGEPILKNRVQKKMIQKSSLNWPTVPQFEKTLNHYSTAKYRKALYVPKRFCVENGLVSERTMFLKNSKEKKWQVKFSFGQNGVLTVGWRVFSIENGLKNGDECIFQLINKNTFLVNAMQNQRVSSVFQEIPAASGRKRRNATGKAQFVDLTSDVNIKSEGEIQIPVASGRKRRNATGKAQFVDLTSDVNIKSEGETQIPVASGRKRKITTGKGQLVGKEDREEGEQILKNRVQKKMIQRSSLNLPTVPQFEKTLNRYSTTKYRTALYIPKRFCVENGLVSDRTMFLKNSKEKKWQVKFSFGENNGVLTVGWRVFSIENGLKNGDECIFQLINKNTFLVNAMQNHRVSSVLQEIPVASGRKRRNATGKAQFVDLTSDVNIKSEGEIQIPVASGRKRRNATGKAQFVDLTSDVNIKSEGETQIPVASGRKRKIATDKGQLVGEEDGEEGEPILKNRVQTKMIQKSSLNLPTVPQFEKTLDCTSTTKHRKALYIPKRFCEENGLLSERTMFLKNSKEKKWKVKFSFERYTGVLTLGWRVFSAENGLKKGDECIFQLINKNTFLVNAVKIYD